MGRVIARKPGVVRKSSKVLKVNEALEKKKDKTDHPATKCKGKKDWREFISCLRKEMKSLMKEEGLAKEEEEEE